MLYFHHVQPPKGSESFYIWTTIKLSSLQLFPTVIICFICGLCQLFFFFFHDVPPTFWCWWLTFSKDPLRLFHVTREMGKFNSLPRHTWVLGPRRIFPLIVQHFCNALQLYWQSIKPQWERTAFKAVTCFEESHTWQRKGPQGRGGGEGGPFMLILQPFCFKDCVHSIHTSVLCEILKCLPTEPEAEQGVFIPVPLALLRTIFFFFLLNWIHSHKYQSDSCMDLSFYNSKKLLL